MKYFLVRRDGKPNVIAPESVICLMLDRDLITADNYERVTAKWLKSSGLPVYTLDDYRRESPRKTYIYTRVSTDGQTTDNQSLQLVDKYPQAELVTETASGAKRRPKLEDLVASLQQGDTLVVAALDRLGRRTSEVLHLIEDLERRGVILKSEREGIDYSTPMGRLVTQILVSVAEMERSLISERTKSALAAKRKQGIVGGRPKTISQATWTAVKKLAADGKGVNVIARELGISNCTVSTYLRSQSAASQPL